MKTKDRLKRLKVGGFRNEGDREKVPVPRSYRNKQINE